MLFRLGRWLRAAGYNTVIANANDKDDDILEQSINKNRILITRDTHFLKHKKHSSQIIVLKSNLIDDCAIELSKKIPINWLYKPFCRCLQCNQLLRNARENEIKEYIRNEHNEFFFCTNCDKLYWMGSHTKRMLSQLKKWKEKK